MFTRIGISLLVAVFLITASFGGAYAAPGSGFDAIQSSAADSDSLSGTIDLNIRCITQNGSIVMCCKRRTDGTWWCEDQL